ncbi:MAG TPA: hypothetical protein DD412_00930 [Holosporales bacterium]|nr:hypothetical protein [Holosporales bacterium]
MTIKFLPVIIGLSVSIAATSTFASAFNDDELEKAIAASLNEGSHVEDEVGSSELALQIAHDEKERREEIEAQERLIREFEEIRAAREEEDLQRILVALSMNDTASGPRSVVDLDLTEQEELARQFAEALAPSLEGFSVEERNPRSPREQQDLEYAVALSTDKLKATNLEVAEIEGNLAVLMAPLGEKELALEALKTSAEVCRAHATRNEERYGGKNPRLDQAASEAEEALAVAEEELRLLVEAKAAQKRELESAYAEALELKEAQELALAAAIEAC